MSRLFSSLPVLAQLGQLNVWSSQCESCEVYHECGGGETAPCGCIFPEASSRFHVCTECKVLCRSDGSGNFAREVTRGAAIESVKVPLSNAWFERLPVFVPTRLDELTTGEALPIRWAGLDLRMLYRLRRGGTISARMGGFSAEMTRGKLRVVRDTELLAVLNGNDRLLEGFWGSDRTEFYKDIKRNRIDIVTGPTFSIYTETPERPASHNVLMQRRHNRCLLEGVMLDLQVVPNLYWRRNEDIVRWASWLRDNPGVMIVSRDFSRTKQKSAFLAHLKGLYDILKQASRPFHVLLVGVGPANARRAMRLLAEIDCTCTVITAYPVLAARSGGRRLVIRDGKVVAEKDDAEHDELIRANLRIMEEFLLSVAAPLPAYGSHLENFMG